MHHANKSTSVVTIIAAASVLSVGATRAQNANPGALLLERYVAAFNNHDTKPLAGIIAANYLQHNGRAGQGLVGTQATLNGYFATFPDIHMQIDDAIVADDKVVARLTLTATHSHPVQLGPGAPVFAPTHKKLTWSDIEIWRIADGKFVEHWDQSDLVGLARQMRAE